MKERDVRLNRNSSNSGVLQSSVNCHARNSLWSGCLTRLSHHVTGESQEASSIIENFVENAIVIHIVLVSMKRRMTKIL